jgi:hypothetical protein
VVYCLTSVTSHLGNLTKDVVMVYFDFKSCLNGISILKVTCYRFRFFNDLFNKVYNNLCNKLYNKLYDRLFNQLCNKLFIRLFEILFEKYQNLLFFC